MSRKVWDRCYDSDDSDVYSDDEILGSTADRAAAAAGSEIGEFQCVHCSANFKTTKELKAHKLKDLEKHEYCGPCDRDFESNSDLKMHLMRSPLHIVCEICYKEFKSKGGLEGHKKQMHRVTQSIRCPGCGIVFQNASGIAQHIESDECAQGLDKATLARRIIDAHDPTAGLDLDPLQKPATTTTHIWRDGIVPPALKVQMEQEVSQERASTASHDESAYPQGVTPNWVKNRVISAPAGGGGSVSSDGREAEGVRPSPSVLDYTDGIGADEDKVYTLADMGKYWNAGQKQFLCPHNACKKKFKKAGAILQHMSSSVHSRRVFRCPTCQDRYKSSSALLQHMESGSCKINQTGQFSDATKTLTGGLIFPM